MELSVKSDGQPVTLEVDVSKRALVIRGDMGEQRVGVFPVTRIEVRGDRLLVGARQFTPHAASGQAPTVLEVQEFATMLRQVAGSSQVAGATTIEAQQPLPSRTNTLNADARNHFRRAALIATFVERAGFIGAILTAIGGFFVACSGGIDCDPYCEELDVEQYPNFSEGITLAFFGAFSMLSIAMVAAYIRGRGAEKGL